MSKKTTKEKNYVFPPVSLLDYSEIDMNQRVEEDDEKAARFESLLTKKGDVTLTDLIAKRDCLNERIGIMRTFLSVASEKTSRYSKTEIKILSTVPVAELQKEVDKYSKELRETDETIQELNWTTELI